jgi:hypothetical protein
MKKKTVYVNVYEVEIYLNLMGIDTYLFLKLFEKERKML